MEAEKGDIVLIPPRYGHVTINPSRDTTLILANLVSTTFVSEYAAYDTMHGAAYYELTGNRLVRNSHYPKIPLPRKIKIRHLLCRSLDLLDHYTKWLGTMRFPIC